MNSEIFLLVTNILRLRLIPKKACFLINTYYLLIFASNSYYFLLRVPFHLFFGGGVLSVEIALVNRAEFMQNR